MSSEINFSLFHARAPPRGRPRKDAQPDRSWKGTQREAPAVKEKIARSLAWKVVHGEVVSRNSRVGE